MKIYTRTGDEGETGLLAGLRVRKNHVRIEAFGSVDELNAHLGVIRSQNKNSAYDVWLAQLQHDLFAVGAILASPKPSAANLALISQNAITSMESWIDLLESRLPPLTQFILPGGTGVSALVHVARAVCRRAERRVVQLLEDQPVPIVIIHFLNRLGDMLFVLARAINQDHQTPDTPWVKKSE